MNNYINNKGSGVHVTMYCGKMKWKVAASEMHFSDLEADCMACIVKEEIV